MFGAQGPLTSGATTAQCSGDTFGRARVCRLFPGNVPVSGSAKVVAEVVALAFAGTGRCIAQAPIVGRRQPERARQATVFRSYPPLVHP